MNVKIPRIITCGDYHDFDHLEDDINKTLCPSPKVKVKELGFVGYNYAGIVYSGRKPSKSWISKELKRLGLKLE